MDGDKFGLIKNISYKRLLDILTLYRHLTDIIKKKNKEITALETFVKSELLYIVDYLIFSENSFKMSILERLERMEERLNSMGRSTHNDSGSYSLHYGLQVLHLGKI